MVRGGLFAPIGRLPNTNRSSIPRSPSLTDFDGRVIAPGRCSHRTRRDSRRPSPRKLVGLLSRTSFGRPALRPARLRLSTFYAADPSRLCFGWMSLARKRAALSRPLSPPGTAHRNHSTAARARQRVFRLRSALPDQPEPHLRHPDEGMKKPRPRACSTVPRPREIELADGLEFHRPQGAVDAARALR